MALERVAHLLCEPYERLLPVGMIEARLVSVPDHADRSRRRDCLSVVHVNRTLQELRGSGLIVLRDRTLTIKDLKVLKDTALSSADYPHTKRRG
ncbi:hypothetical protein CI1B_47530 [Bradyrhizobium ivorense]|uniref:HTH crp-type domain-containing protein n=1 Tax=Bradyrhizobium ivorense TaxID=2511166 RepID=A0A508TEA9_9BRAD|nr:hypothetical protein CI1B_47530 [Bradyrhizobium ivorense]